MILDISFTSQLTSLLELDKENIVIIFIFIFIFIISTLSIMGTAGKSSDHSHACNSPAATINTENSTKSDDYFVGPVPSRVEVEKALYDLQRFVHGVSTSKSKVDGLHELLYNDDSKMMQSPGYLKFQHAFAMMRKEPALQNAIASISCDKTVWEAIKSNKAVQGLGGSVHAAEEQKLLSSSGEADIRQLILREILDFTMSKVIELVENIVFLVNGIFESSPKEKPTSELTDLLEEKLRSSLLLSVVIIMIVVVTRNQT